MCDELGDLQYMRAYVNDKGVPPCTLGDPAHCTDKEKDYLATWTAKPPADAVKEHARLSKMVCSFGLRPGSSFVFGRLALGRHPPCWPVVCFSQVADGLKGKPEVVKWVQQRLGLLKQVIDAPSAHSAEL
jgi:hypothetical protein